MFTQVEIDLIDTIEKMPDNDRYNKYSCIKLYKIKEKYEGRQPRECFCSSVRRRIWSKDFMQWYERSLRQVHH
jgi:hypothetical protein